VHLGTEDGLPKKCVINLDTIITIRKELLAEKITNLAPEKIDKLEEAIKFALDLK
jgi:mRNA interferase MazF